MTEPCAQELCPNWTGDGRVCPCAVFDLDRPDDLEAHALRDYPGDGGLDKVQRGVFLARGGHAPGTDCPGEPPPELHEQHCAVNFHDDEQCNCAWAKRMERR